MQNLSVSVMEPYFNEESWREKCEKIAEDAARRCGLSHDYYVELFSIGIDCEIANLPQKNRSEAITIARDWDYASDSERAEQQEWLSENGYCSHGIELGCCPAGCGSA